MEEDKRVPYNAAYEDLILTLENDSPESVAELEEIKGGLKTITSTLNTCLSTRAAIFHLTECGLGTRDGRNGFYKYLWDREKYGVYDSMDKQITNQPKPEEANNMLTTIETKTFVNGNELSSFSDDQIINLILNTEAEVKRLQGVEITSTAVDKKVKELNKLIKKAAALLDAKK